MFFGSQLCAVVPLLASAKREIGSFSRKLCRTTSTNERTVPAPGKFSQLAQAPARRTESRPKQPSSAHQTAHCAAPRQFVFVASREKQQMRALQSGLPCSTDGASTIDIDSPTGRINNLTGGEQTSNSPVYTRFRPSFISKCTKLNLRQSISRSIASSAKPHIIKLTRVSIQSKEAATCNHQTKS